MAAMKKLITILPILFLALNAWAECFDAHLEAAIAVNKQREKLYAKITDGESVKISQSLILGEKILLQKAQKLMAEAKPFHEMGIRVLCDEFAPMTEIPVFSFELKPVNEALYFVDLVGFRKIAKKQIENKQWPELLINIETVLKEKFSQAQFYCMTKHFLESMYSLTEKAILHQAQAAKLGLQISPDEISQEVLKMHAKYLGLAENLDINAVDVQQKGAGIICQDVPKIIVW